MRDRWLVAFLAVSTAAFAGDWEFDHIVKAIETHYGTKRTHIPFMGMASLFVKVGHPAGASDFKLAVFENLESSSRDPEELDRFMNTISDHGLHPVVRVHSRRNGESTYIYMGDAGKSTRMLIATFQHDQATVVQVKVNITTLLKSVEDPEGAARFLGATNDQ